jgi:hypothetical protein
MRGWRELALFTFPQISDGHFLLVQHFLSTIANEMKTDTNSSRLPTTLWELMS